MVIKLFNLDLHVSVIEDVKDIAQRLFGSQIEITNWSISEHNWVFNKPYPPITPYCPITQETWKGISPELVKIFQSQYDKYLEQFDGFIVTHTPVFCMLYEKYKKPILCVNSCRFNQPFCWNKNKDHEKWLIEGLRRMIETKQLNIISNNKADEKYLLHKTGIQSLHLPSLCLYTKESYNPTKPFFIVQGDRSKIPENSLILSKPDKHSWKELYEYKGIIHFPYEMSTMSIFEQLFAGVPLFFPTPAFYSECIENKSMSFISPYDKWSEGINQDDFLYWVEKADFYNFPFFIYYNSWEDLFQKVSSFQDSPERFVWLEEVKRNVLGAWKEIFQKVFPVLNNTPSYVTSSPNNSHSS